MPAFICMTCGVQYPETEVPPEHCAICEDDRQYVRPTGQEWTTPEALRAAHRNTFKEIEPGLTAIQTEPRFAIGQRPHLIQTPGGNILWECSSLIDEATVTAIQERGGVRAIGISHPHFYDAMVEWSHALGGVPIHLHESNREWVMRPDEAVEYWDGETYDLGDGLTIIRCGGHFPGASVLHWQAGAEGKGVLLSGDTIMVVADGGVSFMYSYPNYIPMSASEVRAVVAAVEPFAYERIYGPWEDSVIRADAKAIVQRSAARYIAHITG